MRQVQMQTDFTFRGKVPFSAVVN